MSAPAAAAGERGGFGRSRREGAPAAAGAGGDKRPRDGDKRPPRKNARAGADEKEWVPITKLGRLVLDGRIRSLEEIFLFSIPIKEYQIVDRFLPSSVLKDEVMKVMPVQKQTSAGQRTRFKAFVVVGDFNGHLGLGCKCAKEVATSIRGAIINAKMNILPIRRGYWGVRVGAPHTVPYKLTGKCGSVRIRLVPAPRGTGLVAAPITKKVLAMAGLDDCYTSAQGHTRTLGNFVRAMYNALSKSYGFLSPDLWAATEFGKTPFQEHTDFLANKGKASRQ